MCRAVISHLQDTRGTHSSSGVGVTFPLLSEAVAGVVILGGSVFQTNAIQVFIVFWGTERLSSVRSLFLTEHQPGLLQNS